MIEVENPHAGEWGVEGLQTTTVNPGARYAAAMVQAIFHAMDEFSRGCQIDDATVLALRVH